MPKINLIIGAGETGQALLKILSEAYPVLIIDKIAPHYDVEVNTMHICFPYYNGFVGAVKEYQKEYNPKYTIIHSTIPIGTTKKCNAYHSPIRGMHPNLVGGIKTFVKYLAPPSDYLKDFFEAVGILVRLVDKPETIEAMKLWDTTQYCDFIRLEKIIYEYCKKKKLDFNVVYSDANQTYNEGYKKLGKENVCRPNLIHIDGKISGKCLIPNCHLLRNKFAKELIEFNKKL